MFKKRIVATAVAITYGLGIVQPALAETRVGVASAVNQPARGIPPKEAERILHVGLDMQADERVITGPAGRAQMIFLDGSNLSVGPNSDLVIDRFIYDPNTKTGELAINAARGVFRFVGGQISKAKPVEFRTPTTVMGLRGGIAVINLPVNRPAQAIFLFGDHMSVTARDPATGRDVVKTALRPGTMIETPHGQAPSDPRMADADEVQGLQALFEVNPAAIAGAPGHKSVSEATTTPVQTTALDAKVTSVREANSAKALETAPSSSLSESPAATVTDQKIAAGGSEQAVTAVLATLPVQEPPAPPVVISSLPPPITFVGRFLRDAPFTSFDNVTLAAPRDPLNNANMTAEVAGNQLKVTTPDGAQILPYLPGPLFPLDPASSSSLFGGVSGEGFVTLDQQFAVYVFDTALGQVHAGILAGVRTPAFPTVGFGQHDLSPIGSDIPFAEVDCFTVRCGAPGIERVVSPLYSAYSPVLTPALAAASNQRAVHMQASLGIVGSGVEQTSFLYGETGAYFLEPALKDVALGGGARGSLRFNGLSFTDRSVAPVASAETGSGNAIFGPAANYMALVPERMTSTASGLVREATAGFAQPFNNLAGFDTYSVDVAIGGPTKAVGTNRNTQTLGGFVGGVGERRVNTAPASFLDTSLGGAAVIQTDAATNRMSATFNFANLARDNYRLNFGDQTGQGGSSAFIDDNLFAARESNQAVSTLNGAPVTGTAFMVTANAVPVSVIDGVTPCACDFLKWGWWTGEVVDAGNNRDRVHLATWVAGVAPTVALPASGTASFSGHAIGNVVNNGAKYIAAGAYNQTWNFATSTGLATISGFDVVGSGVAGGITVSRDLTGAGTAFGGGVTGNLVSGSFFKDTTVTSGVGVGGNFAINTINNGVGYQAAGTFAAKQAGAVQ